MSTKRSPTAKTDSDGPLYYHDYLLGVDIGAWGPGSEREGNIDIDAYGSDVVGFGAGHSRRYMAAWARRTLFRIPEQRRQEDTDQ